MIAEKSTDFTEIKSALTMGGSIAYPTEAVFGLGCDPRNEKALNRILEIKGREAHKGFILIAASQAQLAPFIKPVSTAWQTRLDAVWPGPTTFIIPAAPGVPELLTGGRDTLAVRVSAHPQVVELCTAVGHALVSTSANRSGKPALRSSDEVRQEFGHTIDVIMEGSVGTLDAPTRIFDIRTGQQLR